MSIKRIIYDKIKKFSRFLFVFNHLPFNNRWSVKGKNEIHVCGAMFKCDILVHGEGNRIIVGNDCILKKCKIEIYGNNNFLIIKEGCRLFYTNTYFEDNSGIITIGEKTAITGSTHLACIEGKKIEIGRKCLFSSQIDIRVGDSHSVLNLDNKRINPSKNVMIEDHVWVGSRVVILKGAYIENDCVVGSSTVVTGKRYGHNSLIAGNPAKIVKSDISWDNARL